MALREAGVFFNSAWRWYGNPVISEVEDYEFGLYTKKARDRDQFVYTANYNLPVWSAGNDRDDGPTSQPIEHFTVKRIGSSIPVYHYL